MIGRGLGAKFPHIFIDVRNITVKVVDGHTSTRQYFMEMGAGLGTVRLNARDYLERHSYLEGLQEAVGLPINSGQIDNKVFNEDPHILNTIYVGRSGFRILAQFDKPRLILIKQTGTQIHCLEIRPGIEIPAQFLPSGKEYT